MRTLAAFLDSVERLVPHQVLRLAVLGTAYGCGSAPDFDRLSLMSCGTRGYHPLAARGTYHREAWVRYGVSSDRWPDYFRVFSEPAPSEDSAAMNASWGTSTRPTIFMRFLPSFCFSRSLRLRVMSPP
ncbi:hypothetical protein BH10ACT10_BH10ACT10_20080 [soil metagenome]